MAGTIMNPPTPFVGNLPGQLSDGKSIVVNGLVPHHHHAFAVNLACGPRIEPREDTALHFNVRFNESCVVRNSLQYGNWGSEERHGNFPFQKGVPFEIIIQARHHHFKISINGRHFCDFAHRIPMHQVNTITVEEGINITYVRFDGFAGGFPAAGAYHPPPAPFPGFPGGNQPTFNPGFPAAGAYHPPPARFPGFPGGNQPIFNPSVPFTTSIPGGMHHGKLINISGIPYPNCSRFSINLQCGPHAESVDIGLQFDIRLHYGDTFNQTVRNHRVNGQWGQEERHGSVFPFTSNSNFDILIVCEPNAFKIAVNNQHFAEFAHRLMPLNRINTFHVNGDVKITQIRFQ